MFSPNLTIIRLYPNKQFRFSGYQFTQQFMKMTKGMMGFLYKLYFGFMNSNFKV